MDYPSREPHKQHACPVPLAGGIALFATLLLSEALFGTFVNGWVRATFLAGAVIFLFGLLDDVKSSPPVVKLSGQVIAAVILIQQRALIQIFESPGFFLHTGTPFDTYFDWFLTIFWIVGITNAFNFVDSMDGLAVGLGGLAASFFMLVTFDAGQIELAIHSALIIGCCIALYFFNAPPALLFLGDAGAQTMGFILAVLAIAYVPPNAEQSSSWFVPILLLGVPIFDMALVMVSRMRRRLPIYAASRDHTYHRLIGLGLPSLRAVVLMHCTALGLGSAAFVLLNQTPMIANAGLGVILLVGIAAILILDRKKYWREQYHLM
jgi:UDP-GlcNAc:undecaprenyl-phosphate GlcNAc-1-phosphate transferase